MHFPMPSGDPCYFCEIVNGIAHQWQIIEENDLTMTLLNGRQFEVGQCVIVPRRHAPTLLDLEADEGLAVMSAAKRIAGVFVDVFAPEGILLYQTSGEGSGQEVPHFHLHVVPRQPGSDWGFGPPHLERLERLEREGRLRRDEYRIATDEKLETIGRLQRLL